MNTLKYTYTRAHARTHTKHALNTHTHTHIHTAYKRKAYTFINTKAYAGTRHASHWPFSSSTCTTSAYVEESMRVPGGEGGVQGNETIEFD